MSEPGPKTALKLKGSRPRKAGKISLEKYEAMYEAYCKKQAAKYVARTCGVSSAAATAYVNYGDPVRNLPPIGERWLVQTAKIRDAVATAEVYGAAEAKKYTLRASRLLKMLLVRRLEQAYRNKEDLKGDMATMLLNTVKAEHMELDEADGNISALKLQLVDVTIQILGPEVATKLFKGIKAAAKPEEDDGK